MRRSFLRLCLLVGLFAGAAHAQDASLSGIITDSSGAAVPKASVQIRNQDTGVKFQTQTNDTGNYTFPFLKPGLYEITVQANGFKTVNQTGITLTVAQTARIDFSLQVGPLEQNVTVQGGAPLVNTESAAVSTIVDRQFAENLPMNGRSFQTLIGLAPGVVLTPSTVDASGQFSVNGQRASSNYWMVDGVSANVGMSPTASIGNGPGGALGTFSVQGGTNSLVSVDAMQEFRIQTSSYAPEFGRTPGGQISIVTRSGTNQFHGTAFDYLRNDVLDANDWFANRNGLAKPEERQNDFGGTFSGPIIRDRTFFFFAYEGLRLRLPQVAQTLVPSVTARQNAIPPMQPFLNAFPLPNPGAPDSNGVTPLNASFSNSSTLDAASIRLDHRVHSGLTLFGRYNYSPSELIQRTGGGRQSLNTLISSRIKVQTATVGITWPLSATTSNDFRFNYSRTAARTSAALDNFGGGIPLTASQLPLPSPFTAQNSAFSMSIDSLNSSFSVWGASNNLQRQTNIVDSLALQKGSHSFKLGIDFRRLSPFISPQLYAQNPRFLDVPSAEFGRLLNAQISAFKSATLLFKNLGGFAQDTWRILPRLTMTYGLRWDIDFTPSSTSGPTLAAATGFDLSNLSNLALAPDGTPAFRTKYGNLAPRIGVAYQVLQKQGNETVLRGGLGIFYDLATQEVGNAIAGFYPFAASKFPRGGSFPLSPASADPPAISAANLATSATGPIFFDPNLKLPYTIQWNLAVEQSLAARQSISASYVGSVGRRLIGTETIFRPSPQFIFPRLVVNVGSSDYHALQLQFRRQLSRGIQALASYSWSHSIDTGSVSSVGILPSSVIQTILGPKANRGPSDFDVRHAFSAAVTWDLPVPKVNPFGDAILRGWSIENIIQARSALPVDVFYSLLHIDVQLAAVRPDVVPGVPFYLNGSQYPGGKAFNPAAFTPPPTASGQPLRQGNLGRNALRGFGAAQWDFAVHREFSIHEQLKLQFRAELFSLLNHPNFGNPIGDLRSPLFVNPQFGQSVQMLGKSLGSQNAGGGAFDPLYQIGGPRSIQLALKLEF